MRKKVGRPSKNGRHVHIYIDEDLHDLSKKYINNLSLFVESCIREYIADCEPEEDELRIMSILENGVKGKKKAKLKGKFSRTLNNCKLSNPQFNYNSKWLRCQQEIANYDWVHADDD